MGGVKEPTAETLERGARIKAFRERRGMSQVDLAEAVGVRAVSMWRIEAGKASPRASTMAKIAEVLGVSEKELAYGDDPLDRLVPQDPEVLDKVPPVDELLQEDPKRPGWNEALRRLRGVLEDFPAPIIWHIRESLGRDGRYKYESYKDVILSFKRVQDREMDVETIEPPEDSPVGDEVAKRVEARVKRPRLVKK